MHRQANFAPWRAARLGYLFVLLLTGFFVAMPKGVAQIQTSTGTTAYLPMLHRPISFQWLEYLNAQRKLANLPRVTENRVYSDGAWKHARYMAKNDLLDNKEDPANPWYTAEGEQAARASYLLASSGETSDARAIDLWMMRPFHGLGIIDPRLREVGFGSYYEAVGRYHTGAVLNVSSGRGPIPPTVVFPLRWPGEGVSSPYLSFEGREVPNPLSSCPNYVSPLGAPIYLLLGDGSVTPHVTAHSLKLGAIELEHCVFDETTYVNPNIQEQSLGRTALGDRDAIVLLPRKPLVEGNVYTVTITTNSQTYRWSFAVQPYNLTMLAPERVEEHVLVAP